MAQILTLATEKIRRKENIMKTILGILALITLLASAGAQANCRAGDAAKAGGDVGLARDQAAATGTADNERTTSDTLGKCITGITSVVVAPTFPSLSSIFDAVATKMCKMASDAIPHIPPIVPGNGFPPLPGGGGVPAPAPLPLPGDPRQSNFWSKIWR